MHLNQVNPKLVPGVEVAAGEPVGTLGSTGIHNAPPHLHFAVSRTDGNGGEHYVDPEPMLKQAVLLERPAALPPIMLLRHPAGDVEKLAPPTRAGERSPRGQEADVSDEVDMIEIEQGDVTAPEEMDPSYGQSGE
jgi:hypothetical protein